jgi:ribonuclease R
LNSNHREVIEAEALLAALKSAQDGLTLKQLTAQLPETGSRKPKLRPALRDLVAAGNAFFDGQRYHAATEGKRTHAPSAEAVALADKEAAAKLAAKEARDAEDDFQAAPVPAAPAATEDVAPEPAPSAKPVAAAREAKVKPAITARKHPFVEVAKTPKAAEPQAEAPRAHVVAQEHKAPSRSPAAAKAAAHAPHGHGHKGAKTIQGKVPAALAEGIRLRKDSQKKDVVDPRGAANWGEAREKKAAPAPRQKYGELVGLIHLKAEGYGFVSPLLGASSRDEDVFVPPGQSGRAIDGDIVRLSLAPGRDGRVIGEVIEIVEERRQLALGAYHERGKDAFVEPHDRRMAGPIIVPKSKQYSEGELVKVQIKRSGGGRPDGSMRGEVLGALGVRGEARYEILAAAYAQGFSDEFDAEVRGAAAQLPDHVRPEDHAGRRDLREMPLVTIDGEDARDFDDAVYVEKSGSGYRLVVAIADVASYVHEGGAIDLEALRRATSVYFPGTVLPMLPEQLSNGICSLNPDVERLCMVCDIELDASGAPQSAEVYPAVMKSHARCTYEQVFEVLEGKTPASPRIAAREAELKLAGELAKKMTAIRFGRGALDFDLPESKIILDAKGEVAEITSRPRNDAHRLVEEFMLAANEAVARYFSQNNLPTLYRVHDQPDQAKLEAFGQLAAAHGFKLPSKLTPMALGDLLKQLEGATAQRALTQLLLRAMMQAHYSPDDIGHYGLAAPTYLHFTSPIRRYPDLTVHRLLWKQWARDGKKQSQQEHDEEDAQLAGVGAQCSERERAAMRAERDVVSFYSAQFMQQHVGEEFDATITGVADLGLFCQIASPAVEGLVPAETLGDNVTLDIELQRLKSSGGKTWSLGDSVRIIVTASDPAKRRINFAIAGLGVEAGEDENAEPEATSPRARAFLKSQNHGKPALSGGARPPKRGNALIAESHTGRAPAQNRGFGKELAKRSDEKPAWKKPGKPEKFAKRPDTDPRSGKSTRPGSDYAGKKPFSHGGSDRKGTKPFSRKDVDMRGQFGKSNEAPRDQAGRGPARSQPQAGSSWGQPNQPPRAAHASVKPPEPKAGGWLREDDLAAQANARPAHRDPIGAPRQGRTASRGGPPPRRGQKPNRRR